MKNIAIVGTGISGLTCGYYLNKSHEVTLFEQADYIGGHTHTVEVDNGEKAAIDTGFIVFNDRTYPNFIKLIKELKVDYQPTEMSFSVRNDAINLEYNGHSLPTLFAQRSNVFRPKYLKMLVEIMRFNRDVLKEKDNDNGRTIGDYLQHNNYSALFRDNYLLPMISAIWSIGLESCYDFPLQFFARFFANHGLLDITNRPQWYTIKGGSSKYIDPITRGIKDKINLNTPVKKINSLETGVELETADQTYHFDEVILACHGDQALAMLANPNDNEKNILKKFKFANNHVVLHTDIGQLPKRTKAWASWNYRMIDAAQELTTLTYNMNILQRLKLNNIYLVSLNQDIEKKFILREFSYAHPVYTRDMLEAQSQWQAISGKRNIHYCGAYWYNGFHEDGVRSGLRVCKMLGEEI